MGSDFWIVVHFWGTLFLVGAAGYPLTKRLFPGWFDQGYLFAKAVGMAVVTYVVFLLSILHIAPFTQITVYAAIAAVFFFGLIINKAPMSPGKLRWKILLLEEVFFFLCLLLWSWVKGHEPSIHGLEKFMDYGFMKSILNSMWFPAPDMWYAGFSINYYYFGHTVVAVLTKLSGIDLAYTYNLMLASLFAFTATMSFSIGRQLTKSIAGGILTAWLTTLAGNMQTIYAFTRGYTGEDVQPIWTLLWKVSEFYSKLPEGLERYWYANATRFIPFTIHEFPSYSFVVSDVHGHVLSLPFTLLAIALLIHIFSSTGKVSGMKVTCGFYGLLVSVLLMTNALDGPIYLGLYIVLFIVLNWVNLTNWTNWKAVGIVVGVAALASLPFLLHFSSFVSGVAVNCPPAFLAGKKIGMILFEEVEKCQRSPLWMMYLLWGFFWYCGVMLFLKKKITHIEKLLAVFFVFCLLLLIFPEFFYFKDIYPAHFRSNTMFKLGYQAFIMFSIISGYTIMKHVKNKIFMLLLIPQLFLVSIYPIFSVRSYFDSLRTYKSLDGALWLKEQYPDDYAAIEWLQKDTLLHRNSVTPLPVIVEADGDSYTDFERISAFSGLPTIVGWAVHEWLWRGTYDVVAPRREEVRIIYESEDPDEVAAVLDKYGVSYVVVGNMEREKYPNMFEEKFETLGTRIFTYGATTLYRIDPDYIGVDKKQE